MYVLLLLLLNRSLMMWVGSLALGKLVVRTSLISSPIFPMHTHT
jgi:hypothetical protein